MSKLYFHRKIEYKILRRTEKAILIHVNKLEDAETNYHIITHRLEKYVKPIEMWCPKTWFKKFHENEYVWINGFRKTMTAVHNLHGDHWPVSLFRFWFFWVQ